MDAGDVAEALPTSEGPIAFLMGPFLLGVQDDCAVSNTCVNQEEISLGRGEILKWLGICDG